MEKQFKKPKRVRRRCPICKEKKYNLAKHFTEAYPDLILTDKCKDITLNSSPVEDFSVVQLDNDLFIVIITYTISDRTLTLKIMQLNVVQNPLPCTLTIVGEKFQQLKKIIPIHPYNYEYVVKDFRGVQNFSFLGSHTYPLTLNLRLAKFDDQKIVCELILNNAKNHVNRESLDEFKCPVCWQLPKKPIYICDGGGHNFCKTCYSQLQYDNSNCSVCQSSLTGTRVENVENYLSVTSSHCSNADKGCFYYGMVEDLIDHEETCTKHLE